MGQRSFDQQRQSWRDESTVPGADAPGKGLSPLRGFFG